MRGKHAKSNAKKRKLAGRVLSMCFALVFVFSCLVPTFALATTGGSGTSSSVSAADTEAKTEVKTEAKTEEAGSSTSTATEEPALDAEDEGVTFDPSKYRLDTTVYTRTYRFWLTELTAAELDAINDEVEGGRALDTINFSSFYQSVVYEEFDNMDAPDDFVDPTSFDDPEHDARTFKGWYTRDNSGNLVKFSFTGEMLMLDGSDTVDVFAVWNDAKAKADDGTATISDEDALLDDAMMVLPGEEKTTTADSTDTADSTTTEPETDPAATEEPATSTTTSATQVTKTNPEDQLTASQLSDYTEYVKNLLAAIEKNDDKTFEKLYYGTDDTKGYADDLDFTLIYLDAILKEEDPTAYTAITERAADLWAESSDPTDEEVSFAKTYSFDEHSALYEKLIVCTTADEMDEILANASEEAAAEMTTDELDELIELANTFDDDDGIKAGVLANLNDLKNKASGVEPIDTQTVTVAAGSSVTISNVSNHDAWRIIDSSGNTVASSVNKYWNNNYSLSIEQESSGRGQDQTYSLSISADEDAAEDTYTIQYGTGSSGYGYPYGYNWTDSGYTVKVTNSYTPHTNGGTINKGNGGGTTGTTTEPQPSITKTATKYTGEDNYTYDLALTVSSTVGSSESKVAVDLLFIIDKSGSMEGSNLSNTKAATKSLITSLSENEDLDMQYAVVTFSGDKNDGTYNDASTLQKWTSNAETAKSSVDNISANGGTNYEAGLVQGHDVLTSARESAYKYVIFLSDGVPTYHYTSNGNTDGGGNTTKTADASHAVAAAKTLEGVNGFYTVYVNSDTSGSTYLNSLTTALKSVDSTVSTDNKTSTTGSDLSDIFKDFAKNFTQIACKDVTIEDTLSEHVQPVANATPYVVIKVTTKDASGNETTTTYSTKNGGTLPTAEEGITASYDKDTKQLKLDFPDDYELKDGYTYEVHMDIEPTETAKNTGTSGYDLTADANTGTHARQLGYKSNANNSAKLTYTVESTEKTADYPKPVVHVPDATTLTITKEVTGNGGDRTQEFEFAVTVTDENGETPTGVKGKINGTEQNLSSFKLKSGDSIVLSNVPIGATVKVEEKNADGYKVSATAKSSKTGSEAIPLTDSTNPDKTDSTAHTFTVKVKNASEIEAAAIATAAETGDTATQTITPAGTITVTNNKEIVVNTGVLLDTMPYVVTLGLTGVGALGVGLGKSKKRAKH